jgi:hypothetical protein
MQQPLPEPLRSRNHLYTLLVSGVLGTTMNLRRVEIFFNLAKEMNRLFWLFIGMALSFTLVFLEIRV